MVNSNTPTFQSAPPDGWKPRTPTIHDMLLFKALDACETPHDEQGKANNNKSNNKSSSTSRRLLMSPDDINLQHGKDRTSQQLFSPGKTVNNNKELLPQAEQPFTIATIDLELKATGKIAAISTANIYNEHGCI